MLDRPFPTIIEPSLGSFSGDLQVLLGVSFGVAHDPSRMAILRRAFLELATVGAWGGLAGEHNRPTLSRLHLRDAGVEVAPMDFLWTFDTTSLDPGIVLVIQNLVHGFTGQDALVHSLRVYHADWHPNAPPVDVLPADFEPHPFEVDYSVENEQVAVLVDFIGRHDPDQLGLLCEAWKAWEELAIRGAFADETYRPGRASLTIVEEIRVTSAGVRVVYGDVAIADAGFYCLINMIHVFHERIAPVSCVVLE